MTEHCVDHPKCREDLITRINQRMTTKSFMTTIGTLIVAGGIIVGLAYEAYSQRQKTTQEAVREQTKVVQEADKKLTEIEVNQQHVMKTQEELKKRQSEMQKGQQEILHQLIKIREYQANGSTD